MNVWSRCSVRRTSLITNAQATLLRDVGTSSTLLPVCLQTSTWIKKWLCNNTYEIDNTATRRMVVHNTQRQSESPVHNAQDLPAWLHDTELFHCKDVPYQFTSKITCHQLSAKSHGLHLNAQWECFHEGRQERKPTQNKTKTNSRGPTPNIHPSAILSGKQHLTWHGPLQQHIPIAKPIHVYGTKQIWYYLCIRWIQPK